MNDTKKSWVYLVISWTLLIISIPVGAIAITYFRDMFMGRISPNAIDIARSFITICLPFYWYHLTNVYSRGDYVIESDFHKIYECQNTKTKAMRYIFAETASEAELFLELTDAEESYIVTESEIKPEGFKLLIPDTSNANQ
jgi:hypothetical protein